jgi:hypothetical protein
MSLIKYIRLPFHFDPAKLQEEIFAIGAQWQAHYQTLHYSGSWSAIPLRSVNGKSENIIVSPEDDADYCDTSFLQASPYINSVLSHFNFPLNAVRLLKLDAGSIIKEHKDADLAYEHGEIRLHIPVITNDAVEFYLDKERIILKEGECWYMNFNLPHSIENKSKHDRIHLVIDGIVNDWVKDLFARNDLYRKDIDDPKPDPTTQRQIIAQLRSLNTETGDRLADEMENQLQ